MPDIKSLGNAVTLSCVAALLTISVPGASEIMKIISQALLGMSCWLLVKAKVANSKPAEIFGYSVLALCYIELAVLGTIQVTERVVSFSMNVHATGVGQFA